MPSAEQFIEKYTSIKTLPHVVTRLSRLVNDENATMKDFEEIIKMDPTLVVRLLRLVNSPYFGLRQNVDSIGRAVTFIGMKNLQNMAVTDAMRNIFRDKRHSKIFSRKHLWLHCVAVGICSKMVAERIFGINGDDAYLCGILHDFGLIVEEQVEPKNFLEACKESKTADSLIENEQRLFDTNHCEIGHLMTLDWQMPVTIQHAIRDHHKELSSTIPSSLTGILQISEYVSAQFGYTAIPDLNPQLAEPLITHLRSEADEYQVLIDDFPEEMQKAKEIYDS